LFQIKNEHQVTIFGDLIKRKGIVRTLLAP
jgi:hypothetical protein